MADNIHAPNNEVIAAKDLTGVLFPRNIITAPDGTELTPLTDEALRATPVPVSVSNAVALSTTDRSLLAAIAPPSTQVVAVSGPVGVVGTFYQATQPVSLASQPLPTGAATESTLAAVNTKLAGSLAVTVASVLSVSATSLPLPTGASTETTLAAVNSKLGGTLTVSATALPLPTGAATETTLAAVSAKLAASIAVTGTFWQATQPVSGTFWQATQPVSIASAIALDSATITALTTGGGLTDTQLRASPVPVVDTTAEGYLAYLPSINAQLRSGSNTSSNALSVVIASDQLGLADFFINGAYGPLLALNTNIVDQATGNSTGTNVLSYRSIFLSITPAAGTVTAGAITFEASNDGTNFVQVPLYDLANLTANPVTSYTVAASTTRYFGGQLPYKFFRARISTAVTGTTTGVTAYTLLKAIEFYSPQQTVTQQTAGNLNVTVGSGTVTTVGSSTPVTPTTTFTNSAASTNATAAKTSAGTLWSGVVTNQSVATKYLKLYNKASAPTIGTDIPVLTIAVPVGVPVQIDGGSNGLRFSTGIAFVMTGALADTDTTAVAVGDLKLALTFT